MGEEVAEGDAGVGRRGPSIPRRDLSDCIWFLSLVGPGTSSEEASLTISFGYFHFEDRWHGACCLKTA